MIAFLVYKTFKKYFVVSIAFYSFDLSVTKKGTPNPGKEGLNKMRNTETNKRGYTFTTYTAAQPYRTAKNGLRYFKQLITWDNSRFGRVIYDRTTFIDNSQATYPQKTI